MKAFISYSSQQLKPAQKIKCFLYSINIDSFIADDDLRAAAIWKDKIIAELNKCDLFIPLLSKEFKESDWCSQEMGIAYIQGKKIIPVSLDDTRSYGFINHIQSKSMQKTKVELILSEGLMETNGINNAAGFIRLLEDACGYRCAEEIYNILEPFFDQLSVSDLNSIVEASIKNDQIWNAGWCVTRYIPHLLEIRKKDIDPLLQEKLTYQLKHRTSYPKSKEVEAMP